jgi:hypothetical protein
MQPLSTPPSTSAHYDRTKNVQETEDTPKTGCFTWLCCWCCKKRTPTTKTNQAHKQHVVVRTVSTPKNDPIIPVVLLTSGSSSFLGGRTRAVSLEQAKIMHRRTESDLIKQSQQKTIQEEQPSALKQAQSKENDKKEDDISPDFVRQEETNDAVVIIDD